MADIAYAENFSMSDLGRFSVSTQVEEDKNNRRSGRALSAQAQEETIDDYFLSEAKAVARLAVPTFITALVLFTM